MNPLDIQLLAEGWLSSLVVILPISFAFAAGMVSTVNPCGFALLPAYLALFLRGNPGNPEGTILERFSRAVLISLVVTMGFVILFGIVGIAIASGGRLIIQIVPWIALLIGVGLIGMGLLLLRGKKVYSGVAARLAARLDTPARGGVRSFFLFGITYAVASLSCTLPIFLVVVGSSLAAGGLLLGFYQFISYALGMGLVLTVLTIGTALFKETVAGYMRTLLPVLDRVSAGLLLLAGAFIVYYWLTIGGLGSTITGLFV
ncbi:MAG: cytochrome c biogenesis CcdA family protein [Dehalococcoidia bacterium]